MILILAQIVGIFAFGFNVLSYQAKKNQQLYIMQGISGYFPWVAIVIVIIKEAVMIYGSSYMLAKDIVVYAHGWGKLAQCSFILALVLSFWHPEFTQMNFPIDRVCLWIAVVLAIIALVDDTTAAIKTLNRLKEQKAE